MVWDNCTELRRKLDSGELNPLDVVQASLERMESLEPRLNALVSLPKEQILQAAQAAEQRLKQGETGAMLGIPVVLKDNLNWTGTETTAGSRILMDYISPYDATVVHRLLEAGAVPIAKANLDEFAMGSSGEFSAFGPTRNPWDPERVPGGSSSGSAAAVAAGYAPVALGSDTGGSVRLPASFCNLTALRPSYGILSRYGVVAFASSLDQVGPMAHGAQDVAMLLSVLAGRDPQDSTSLDLPAKERLFPLQPASLKGLRIGIPQEYFGEGLDERIRRSVEEALHLFRGEGAILKEVSLPHTSYALATYYLICTSEASSNLSRFDGVRFGRRAASSELQEMLATTREEGFGPEVKRRILLGTFCLSKGYYEAFYLKALKARTLIRQDFQETFEQVDIMLTPVSPVLPVRLGEKTSDPLAMYLLDLYTVNPALAALPCLSLPCRPVEGLPVGFQLIGPSLKDVRLLEIAEAFQQLTSFHLNRAPIWSEG